MQRVLVSGFVAFTGAVNGEWPTESASYPHHPGRSVSVLSGEWDFSFDSDYDVEASTSLDFSFAGKQIVPGAWDAARGTGIQYSRGTGAYRVNVSIAPKHPAVLHFAACSMFCRIYVDGSLLLNHTSGGYTPFSVNVPFSGAEQREIVVVASNQFSSDLTPTHLHYYDFYQYGGLIREVSLHVLPTETPHLNRIEVVPQAGSDGAPNKLVDLKLVLSAPDGSTNSILGSRVSLRRTWDDDAAGASIAEYVIGEGGVVEIPNVPVPSAKVWDPSSSARPLPLHKLKVEVAEKDTDIVYDGLLVRFGLRTVGKKGRDILLNGMPLKLKGVNRHDMYPNEGPVMTVDQYKKDLRVIQETLNGNFIRGAHYPQDDRFLDLCDELGVFVWAEALAWGNSAKTMRDQRFMKAQFETVSGMLDRSFNHPSIILWGFFNEGHSDDASTEASYAAMSSAFRARDSSRLITWASNKQKRDLSLKYADVISFNGYPGWYGGDYTTIEKSWLDNAAWVASNFPESPFIISEAGAGGIVGNHSDEQPAARWSLEYQSLVVGITTRTAMNSTSIAGISLWQFSDNKVDAANTSTGRPGGINNKGIVDRWRNPKPAASVVAAAYGTVVTSSIV